MGVSTDGFICFGLKFDEDVEFPWSEQDSLESWWKDVNGYQNPFELYGSDGNYLPHVKLVGDRFNLRPTDDVWDAFYGPMLAWEKANPLPIELVNYCSGDCPMWIIALPDTVTRARRGYPVEINDAYVSIEAAKTVPLLDFCAKYGISGGEGPQWWLGSYWG